MRIGIVGDKDRAAAWEKHLRPLTVVEEVVIAASLPDIGNADACLLLDDSAENLDHLIEAIKLGFHSFLISQLPVDENRLNLIYRYAQESDVRLQFSHWPTISPSAQYMRQQLPRPSYIQVIKENSQLSFTEIRAKFTSQWQDEVAWITRWMDMETHRIDTHPLLHEQPEAGIQIHMKFENGASAFISILNAGTENRHRRLASGSGVILDCDVELHSVKKTNLKKNPDVGLFAETRTFDATQAAPLSANLFFKAIKLKRNTAFSAYDALRASRVIGKIKALNPES